MNKSLAPNFKNGLLVHFKDQKMEHGNVASDARGAKDVWQINEEQAFSGMGMMPAFFGRNYSTTETFAYVVYNLLLAKASNIQRLVKRRREATNRLDLRLAGIDVAGVSMQFNRAHSLNPLEEAQADEARVRTVILKAEKGIISPDDAAQELGYESAYDPELLNALPQAAQALQRAGSWGAGRAEQTRATFRFDRACNGIGSCPKARTVCFGRSG